MVSCVYKNRNINEYPIVTGSGLDPFRLFSDTLTSSGRRPKCSGDARGRWVSMDS